jgi:cell division protein FtsQ
MTSITSVSHAELTQRRQELRRQRRLKLLQSSWRTLAVSGLAGSLVWVITLPGWVIRKPDQVAIEGNQLLSGPALQSQLPLAYPQSLLRIKPQVIAATLESKAPIAKATVTRHLFPPRLTVQVKEQYPVAIAQPAAAKSSSSSPSSANIQLLNKNGVGMPLETYTSLDPTFKLPDLKVIGMRDQYRPYWSKFYQAISRSPVKVLEIDWRDPANLILKTDLGMVHFGSYSSKFAYQLNSLDRMRQLAKQLPSGQVAYIDLKNPAAPSIQMTKNSNPVKTNMP